MPYAILLASVLFYILIACSAQTFPGFLPATSDELILAWNGTALNYSGEELPLALVATALPTFGLPYLCNGSYLLVMVDPDAVGGNIETTDGLHTIQGNYTCSSSSATHVSNTIFYALTSNSSALAPFIPPEPQPQAVPSIHRYTVLLFQQAANFTFPSAYSYALPLNLSNVTNRLDFNIEAFAQAIQAPLVAASTFDVLAPSLNSTNSTTATSTASTATSTASAASSTSTSAALAATGDASDFVLIACAVAGMTVILGFVSYH